MDFQPLTGLVGRLPTSLEPPSAPGEIDKNGFLKLMIEQLKYQDPLNPMDSQQYSAQLAQFTQLEEQQNGNALLEQGLNADILLAQSINNTLAATLVGQEVKAVGNTVNVTDGKAGDISFETSAGGGNVRIQIHDSSGKLVRTLDESILGRGEHKVSWDGRNDLGDELPGGSYTFTAEIIGSDGSTTPTVPYIIGTVEAVRYTDSGAVLIVDGQQVGFGDVLELRNLGTTGSDTPDPDDGSTNPLDALLSMMGLRSQAGGVR